MRGALATGFVLGPSIQRKEMKHPQQLTSSSSPSTALRSQPTLGYRPLSLRACCLAVTN